MRTPPVNWANLMTQQHSTEARIQIAGDYYYGFDGNSGIWSLKTSNALFEQFSVGNCYASTINLVLVNPSAIPTMAEMKIDARLKNEQFNFGEQRVSLGTAASVATTVFYSNEIEEIDGVISLKEPVSTRSVSYNSYSNMSALRGKYWQRANSSNPIFYSPSDANYTRRIHQPAIYQYYYTYIDAWEVSTATDWVRKGDYFIDTREWDAQHEFLTITGYDAMLKGEVPYLTTGDVGQWPKVDTDVVDEICTKLDVELDTRSVLDKGYMVQLPAVSSDGSDSYTVREVLGYIGAMYGGNWIISDEGKLLLVPLVPTQTAALAANALDVETSPAYEAIGTIQLIVTDKLQYVSGSGGRVLEITCPWGTQEMADDLLDALGGFVYQPIKVTTAYGYDLLWELGDELTVNGYTSMIAAVDNDFCNAFTADVAAPGGGEIDHEYPFISPAVREVQREVARTMASLRIDVDRIEAEVSGKIDETEAQTLISQGLGSITLSATAGTNSSTITISAGGVVVDSQLVSFSRVVADSISASDIGAGRIHAINGSAVITMDGLFDFYANDGTSDVLCGYLGAGAGGNTRYMYMTDTSGNGFAVGPLVGTPAATMYIGQNGIAVETNAKIRMDGYPILTQHYGYGTQAMRDGLSPSEGQLFFVID